jgi:hypothetical protein
VLHEGHYAYIQELKCLEKEAVVMGSGITIPVPEEGHLTDGNHNVGTMHMLTIENFIS